RGIRNVATSSVNLRFPGSASGLSGQHFRLPARRLTESERGNRFRDEPLTDVAAACKRTIDFVLAVLLLFVLSPLFVLAALLIKLTSRGPVLFWQKRVGRG